MSNYINPATIAAMIIVGADFTGTVTNGWTGTAISTGTLAKVETRGGAARLSGAATTDDSGYQIQRETAPFVFGKKDWLSHQFTIKSSAAALGWIAGVIVKDTTIYAGVSDGIYLQKTEGSSAVKLFVYAGSVKTVDQAIGSLDSTSAYVTYRIEVQVSDTSATQGKIKVYADDKLYWETDYVTIPSVALADSFAMQSGSAVGTQSIDIDYTVAQMPR